jgi:hypothetical protein
VKGLLKEGNHLVTPVKSNAVAYLPVEPKKGRRNRGRPKLYGKKIRAISLLTDHKSIKEAVVNGYGEGGVKVRYCVRDLMWRPVGRLVRFVAVVHPTRGSILLMSTDLTLCALDIISLRPSFQDRTHVQAGCALGRFILLPFLDDGYETVALPERKSVPSSRVRSLPRQSPPQPTMSSRRLASSPTACYSISRSSLPSWFGSRSARGSEPFVQAFHHRNLSSAT